MCCWENGDIITIMMVTLILLAQKKSFDPHPMKEVWSLDLKTKVQTSTET